MQWVVAVVAAVAVLSAYVTWLAARLDRLASRCEAGALALQVALARQEAGASPSQSEQDQQQAQLRVDLARRVHDDALHDDQVLRRRIPVRMLGLSRRHPISAYALLEATNRKTELNG